MDNYEKNDENDLGDEKPFAENAELIQEIYDRQSALFNKITKKATLNCSNCGCELAWVIPGENRSICSSEYAVGFGMCYGCLLEHCLQTNCLGCELRKYPDCSFIPRKKYAMAHGEE